MERVGPHGSCRANSNMAVGHNENLVRPGSGLGVSVGSDRLLHAGDRGLEALEPLPNRRRSGNARANRVTSASCRKPRGELDTDHRQRHSVHYFPVPGNARTAWDHASLHGLLSPGGQRLHRMVPSQLKRGGSLGLGVSRRRGSTGFYRSLDRGVQSPPVSSRRKKSFPLEAFGSFAAVLKNEALTL